MDNDRINDDDDYYNSDSYDDYDSDIESSNTNNSKCHPGDKSSIVKSNSMNTQQPQQPSPLPTIAATTTSTNRLWTNTRKKKSLNFNFKKRKCRTTFTKIQLNILENEFLISNFVSNDRMYELIETTGLDSRIIKVKRLI